MSNVPITKEELLKCLLPGWEYDPTILSLMLVECGYTDESFRAGIWSLIDDGSVELSSKFKICRKG